MLAELMSSCYRITEPSNETHPKHFECVIAEDKSIVTMCGCDLNNSKILLSLFEWTLL